MVLYGMPLHLEQLAGYRGVGLVDHAGVALGVAVHQALLLLDVLECLVQMPPAVDGLTLPPLLSACSLTGAEKPPEEKAEPRGQVPPPLFGPLLPALSRLLPRVLRRDRRPGTSSWS